MHDSDNDVTEVDITILPKHTFICDVADVPVVEEQQSLSFNLDQTQVANGFEAEVMIDGQTQSVFLIRADDSIKAYINSCPHTGAKLNWEPARFLDSENLYIQCSIHGAIFEKNSGVCLHGPCINQSLTPVDLLIENDKVYLFN